MYVDDLIGPHTVNTMPEATLEAFEDHGKLARTVDADFDAAQKLLDELAEVGIDLHAVTRQLEEEGVVVLLEVVRRAHDHARLEGRRPRGRLTRAHGRSPAS